MATSAYIHIPFCKHKCKYCSFVSFACLYRTEEYITALQKEIESKYHKEKLKTLYIGGGTPSLLNINQLKTLLEKFNLEKDCEVTIEVNPDDVNSDYLKQLREIGFNRISLGAQTFDDTTLKLIGRRHDAKQILTAVELIKKAKFKNISLDLIYGLPKQSLDTLKKDLETILTLQIQHLSTYGLKIEENSFWGKFPPDNIPDDDTQADMYLFINKYLENVGYKRYEISNFALENFESRHNLNYWNNEEYYGFGVAAHGYINGTRYSNVSNLDDYIDNPYKCATEQKLTFNEILEEEIFLGFRKEAGINTNHMKKKYNIDFEKEYEKIINKYNPEYIKKTAEGYKLTIAGILISNIILSEFITLTD